jgi:phosphopantothenoylcysteine decarboxylase/phosphopantothenate--cysteine ligase
MPSRDVVVDRLVVCATGSIAINLLTDYLVHLSAFVASTIKVTLTRSAELFVRPQSIEPFCDDVICDSSTSLKLSPPELALWADGFIVLPATAHSLASGAHGFADGMSMTSLLCFSDPVLYFPSMNTSMLHSPSVQRNIQQIRDDGDIVIDGVLRDTFVAAAREVQTVVSIAPPRTVVEILRDHYSV